MGNTIYNANSRAAFFLPKTMDDSLLTTEHANCIDEIVRNIIEQHVNEHYTKNIFFTPGQIWYKIKQLSNRKAPCPDRISNSCWKHSGKVILLFIQIYNSSNHVEYFPEKWMHEATIMIPKGGKTWENSQTTGQYTSNPYRKTIQNAFGGGKRKLGPLRGIELRQGCVRNGGWRWRGSAQWWW